MPRDNRALIIMIIYSDLFETPQEGVCPICTGQARMSFHAAHTCEILQPDRIKALKGLRRAHSQISKIYTFQSVAIKHAIVFQTTKTRFSFFFTNLE